MYHRRYNINMLRVHAMSYMKTSYKRPVSEKIFLTFFLPLVLIAYILLKFPQFLVNQSIITDIRDIYLLDKSPYFWYSTLYTAIVCGIAGKVLIKQKSPYKKSKKAVIDSYQNKKFASIFLVQLVLLYLIPYVIMPLLNGKSLSFDATTLPSGDAYVYISKGFTSWGGLIYVLVLVPLSVYFFGKRYCSWFCACGNLSETVGITKWGAAWVKFKTPTGKLAKKMESLQTVFMLFGFAYGFVLFLDFIKIVTAENLLLAGKYFQDFAVDFIFGAIIGIGAYPFLGTRVWCRYGCPLAKMMELFGRYGKSKFQVTASDKCKGLDLCSQVCPMGIDVASYAHKDKKPIEGSFGLDKSPCIGCGGCVDICPVNALHFKAILNT